MAQELASDSCIRCSNNRWKTAALIYEGLEWKYYYCYECGRWFKRHFRFRYAVLPVDDVQEIVRLIKQVELRRAFIEVAIENTSWWRGKLSSASRFFQRYLPI